MIGKEIERRREDHRVIETRAKRIGIEPGEREKPPGSLAVFKHPSKSCERQRASGKRMGRVRIFVSVRDCGGLWVGLGGWRTASLGRDVAKRIMVVEDNDLNRRLFCDVLQANGFDVEPVANGNEVLASARAQPPDLIIMDIQLPGISGVDLIEAARKDKQLAHIPVLAVTAFAAKGDEERIRAAGASGYLSKPVSIMPFMNAVKELIDQ